MPGWKDLFPVDLAEEGRLSRREFARFMAVVSTGFTVGIGWLWARRQPLEGAPAAGPARPETLKVCRVADLAPGNSFLFTYRDDRDRCILIHTQMGELRAYRQSCTHLGCAVRWDGRKLECPCHNGAFEVEQGFPIQGPPTRPLSRLDIEVDHDGWIWVRGDLPKPGLGPEGGQA
jgi:nitrite reductase/ring-hydroxylating ferredoxin subunit